MATNIPYGSALARKVYGAALFAAVQIEPGFMNLLTGPAPKQAEAEAKLKELRAEADYMATELAKKVDEAMTAKAGTPADEQKDEVASEDEDL